MDHINFYVRGNGGVTVACVDCQWFVRMEDAEVDLEEINRLTQGHHDAENNHDAEINHEPGINHMRLTAKVHFVMLTPLTDRADELIRWRCTFCNEITTEFEAHAQIKHGAQEISVSTVMGQRS